jgi:hypothetical protein
MLPRLISSYFACVSASIGSDRLFFAQVVSRPPPDFGVDVGVGLGFRFGVGPVSTGGRRIFFFEWAFVFGPWSSSGGGFRHNHPPKGHAYYAGDWFGLFHRSFRVGHIRIESDLYALN